MQALRSLLVLSLLAAPAFASDALFQYAIPIESGKGVSTAFLWLPPAAGQVRGVVICGMTLGERPLVQDDAVRKACADKQLAIIFLKSGLGNAEKVQAILDEFAKVSGYHELSIAPLFFLGHSAGGPPAKALAIALADRCFGVMQYRGGVPGPMDGKSDTVPAGVPALMMVGQFDEFGGVMRSENGRENAWESGIDGIKAFRASDPAHLGSIVVEPGAGHFAWSERNGVYLGLFLKKAADARIPDWPLDAQQPVKCKAIDVAQGWLTSLGYKTPDAVEIAAYGAFKGDKAQAAWHFDEELARATLAYMQGLARKDQFIKWNDAVWVEALVRNYFTAPKWIDDGCTLEVHPVYTDKYPDAKTGSGKPRWDKAGEPVGHSTAEIRVKTIGSPLVPTGPHTLRLQCNALSPAGEGGRLSWMAYSAGDSEYRYTELVGMVRGFSAFTKGKEQTISFPPIGDRKASDGPVALQAKSDAGRTVEYYVAYGPARIDAQRRLVIADMPARPKFPIEVKVVAYQYGSGSEPFVKSAAPVEQVLQVTGR
jgi:pimeloyl-ACP methyl ester carboxylesterase